MIWQLQSFTYSTSITTDWVSTDLGECQSRKLYNTLVILLYFMDTISPNQHWRMRLKDLIAEHDVLVRAMDFPANWQSLPIWQDS